MKKALLLISAMALAAAVQAAPTLTPEDISENVLREIATDRQKASMDEYNKARQQAEKKRDESTKEARDLTARNNNGMKKTIQKRHLNSMLPPCEREVETPREPGEYDLRY